MGTLIIPTGATPQPQSSPQSSIDSARAGASAAADDMGWGDKALINVGAGMDNLWQGAKQLFGKGMSDQELREKRARDEALAEKTTGGGALQLAGEILPTMVIPAGGAAGAAGRGLSALFGRGAAGVARLGTVALMADSALMGGAAGALQPTTSDESKLANTALGAGGGALLPGVLAGGSAFMRKLTSRGAADRAAEQLIASLGGASEGQAAADTVRNFSGKQGPFTRDIPMTPAEITQNPVLAKQQMVASAGDKSGDWANFRQGQAQARYGALEDITADAANVDKLAAARDTATGPMRDKALKAAGKDQWFSAPVAQATQDMLAGGSGSNPAVKSIGNYVQSALEDGITPERLYTVRKVLTDKLSGPAQIGDTLSAAAKSAQRETMGMIKSIDLALDRASGGKWTPYMERYGDLSKPVNSAAAQRDILGAYTKDGAAMVGGGLDAVPSVTRSNLGRNMDRFGADAFGDKLDFGTRDAFGQLIDNIGRSDGLMSLLKGTMTSGGGSMTAPLGNAMEESAVKALSSKDPTGIVGMVAGHSQSLYKAALSQALQNPDVFVQGITRRLAQGRAPSPSEQFVLQLVRSSGTLPVLANAQSR